MVVVPGSTFTSKPPALEVTVCASESSFRTRTRAPGATVAGVLNSKSLIVMSEVAAGVEGSGDGAAPDGPVVEVVVIVIACGGVGELAVVGASTRSHAVRPRASVGMERQGTAGES